MNAKGIVTASMVYIGVLALVANNWLGSLRRTVQNLSGSGKPDSSGPWSSGGGGGGGSW